MPVYTRSKTRAAAEKQSKSRKSGDDLNGVNHSESSEKTNTDVQRKSRRSASGARKTKVDETKVSNSSPNNSFEETPSKILSTSTTNSHNASLNVSQSGDGETESDHERSVDVSSLNSLTAEGDISEDSDSDFLENHEDNQTIEPESTTLTHRNVNTSGRSVHSGAQDSKVTTEALKKEIENQQNGGSNIILIIILIVLFVAGFVGLKLFENYPNQKSDVDNIKILNTRIEELKSKYPGQSPRFWFTIYLSFKSIVSVRPPQQPAVIMIAGKAGTYTVENIARDIANSFPLSNEKAVEIDSESLLNLSPDEAKETLDIQLEAALGGESKAAIVQSIETLTPEAALMFHKYCDNENAPFKKSVLVLTVCLPEDFDGAKITEQDEENVIEKYVTRHWSGKTSNIGIDQIAALFSRIANSVVIMKHATGPN